jgi:hypothetical protein
MVLKCEADAFFMNIDTFYEMFCKTAIYSCKAKAYNAGTGLVKFFSMFLVCVCSYNVDTCHVKFLTTLMVSMAVVLYQSTNILYVFMVLPGKTWAEDRIMSTQVKLQQDEMAWLNMFKMKTKSNSRGCRTQTLSCWWSVSVGFYRSSLCLQFGETLVSIASSYVDTYCTTRNFVVYASYR